MSRVESTLGHKSKTQKLAQNNRTPRVKDSPNLLGFVTPSVFFFFKDDAGILKVFGISQQELVVYHSETISC